CRTRMRGGWTRGFRRARYDAERRPSAVPDRSELLRDPRRFAVEDPYREDADRHVYRGRHEQACVSARNGGRTRGVWVDDPLTRQLEDRSEGAQRQHLPDRV